MEIEILKTYITTYLKTEFIQLSKSPTSALILFNKKPDGSFCLCIDYWDLKNFTIKNWYLLYLIGESFDRFSRVKKFIQLDLTSVYDQMRIKEGDE